MRGEQRFFPRQATMTPGSPPHARRAARRGLHRAARQGITPACAGSSWASTSTTPKARDHPRMRGEQVTITRDRGDWEGSPPHARGAGHRLRAGVRRAGITPACAGSSPSPSPRRGSPRDHPRMRGEQVSAGLDKVLPGGSPPHARGAGHNPNDDQSNGGITPACAGSSLAPPRNSILHRDHPRMRGEQKGHTDSEIADGGSPPHARGAEPVAHRHLLVRGITPACAGSSRITHFPTGPVAGSPPHARGAAGARRMLFGDPGITPACAGSRPARRRPARAARDHPRMRGEQVPLCDRGRGTRGSPPHARGAGTGFRTNDRTGWITPACAGSSKTDDSGTINTGDHPRMRGEQVFVSSSASSPPGSPPHARGAEQIRIAAVLAAGITPACAGSSCRVCRTGIGGRDHPRMRGEQKCDAATRTPFQGSPPHARGADSRVSGRIIKVGITPACAGSRPRAARPSAAATDHPRMRGEQVA